MTLHTKFTKRCLHRSISFLYALQIVPEQIELSPKDQQLIALFYTKDYVSISKVVCQHECQCCSSHHKFLSSYTQIIHSKMIKQLREIQIDVNDPYTAFLSPKDDDESIKRLLQIDFFYEAFDELLMLIDQSNFDMIEFEIESALSDDVLIRIYFMLIFVYRFYKCKSFQVYFDDLVHYFKIEPEVQRKRYRTVIPSEYNEYIIGLLAAVLYVDKQYDKSLELFQKIETITYNFMDFYSNLLYIKNDLKQMAILSKSLNYMFPLRPETYVCIGNYHSSQKEHQSAIESFTKAIKMDERFQAIHTLIAHEYMEQKDSKSAIIHFNKAIAFNKNDFRAIFGMGDVLKSCGYVHIAVLLYTRAVELQSENGYCWLVLGNTFMNMKKYENALKCFKRSQLCGEDDALRSIGDCLRRLKKYEEAVKAYERFVEKKGREEVVCGFLAEYYENKGNHERSLYYKVEKET